jgi:hypothetical protein
VSDARSATGDEHDFVTEDIIGKDLHGLYYTAGCKLA